MLARSPTKMAISPTAPAPVISRMWRRSEPLTNLGPSAPRRAVWVFAIESFPALGRYAPARRSPYGNLDFASRLEGGGKRAVVEIIQFAPDRHALRQARYGHARGG